MYQLYFDDRRRSHGPTAAPIMASSPSKTSDGPVVMMRSNKHRQSSKPRQQQQQQQRPKRFSLDPRILKQMINMRGGGMDSTAPEFDGFRVSIKEYRVVELIRGRG